MNNILVVDTDINDIIVQKTFIRSLKNILERKLEGYKYIHGAFLAGSSANNELLMERNNNALRIVSDIEVGVVTNNLLKRKNIRDLSRQLSDSLNIEVELFMVTKRRLKNCLPNNLTLRSRWITIHAYEIFKNKEWIFVKRDKKDYETSVCKKIHLWEGVRLVLNRFCEGAPWIIPWLKFKQVSDKVELSRWITKLLNGCGDCLLLSNYLFAKSYRERGKLWRFSGSMLCEKKSHYDIIYKAYLARCQGKCVEHSMSPTLIYEVCRSVLRSNLAILWNTHNKNQFNFIDIQSNIGKYKIPCMFQTGINKLDIILDTLFRLKQIGGYKFNKILLLKKWNKKSSFSHWAYSIVLYSLLQPNINIAEEVFSKITNKFNYNKSSIFPDLLYDWWQYTCK